VSRQQLRQRASTRVSRHASDHHIRATDPPIRQPVSEPTR
jgi:hypothetical protein